MVTVPVEGQATRVLLADDDPPTRSMMQRILNAAAGIEVVAAVGDGEAAVAAAMELRPDVALLDIRMPRLDGIRATARITSPAAALPTKVVLITTFDVDHYVHAGIRNGARGFLLKDSGPEEIVRAIQVVMAGDAVLAPFAARNVIDGFARRSPAGVPPLTGRESDVLELVVEGLSNSEIAERLVISYETVKSHVANLLTKFGARDRVQLVIRAYRIGLVASGPEG